MTITKTKIFMYNSDLYRTGKGPRWWFKEMDTESATNLPIIIKWIVSELNTELLKVNILPHTLI